MAERKMSQYEEWTEEEKGKGYILPNKRPEIIAE